VQTASPLFSNAKESVAGVKPATFLPTSRAEMTALGWTQCDIIIVTGDAYVDHPSFGMAIIGRLLEAKGFKVGIIAQPDWHGIADFESLGKPRLFFGVTGGNMDSMVNATPRIAGCAAMTRIRRAGRAASARTVA